MKTIRKVIIEPVYVEGYIPEILEENKLYISKQYGCITHNCLCGCGLKTHTPIDSNGWTLIEHEDGKISLTPSISNCQYPCKSHYIITKNVANFV